jgi:hypothetical protein
MQVSPFRFSNYTVMLLITPANGGIATSPAKTRVTADTLRPKPGAIWDGRYIPIVRRQVTME